MKLLLNIVDVNDKIIGEKTREEIHKHGLLHREVHVYFITPNYELIVQHRAKDKDTYPDLLDATVGGHVEIGDSYEETALKETEEETGIKIKANDLIFVDKTRVRSEDVITKTINNSFRVSYLYIYRGNIKDLKIELGKSQGFGIWSLDKLSNLSAADKVKFIPYILETAVTQLVATLNNIKL
jgi:isopentenyldiphosphate isomerase